MRYFFIFLLFFGFVAGLMNCSEPPCMVVDCGENGVCAGDSCFCDPGYSGLRCEFNVCDDVVCNNGNCNDAFGFCECFAGYEGDDCLTVSRIKFLGMWNTDEWLCDTLSPVAGNFTINTDSLINLVTLNDPLNTDVILGVRVSNDSLIIGEQVQIIDTDTLLYFGLGRLKSDSLCLDIQTLPNTGEFSTDTIFYSGIFTR